MLKELRKHLIHLNLILTSLILTIALATSCYMNISQLKAQCLSRYTSLKDSLLAQLSLNNVIHTSALLDLESANHLIIHMEDNTVPFFFPGGWTPDISRDLLVNHVKSLAAKEGFQFDSSPLLYSDKTATPVYQFSYTKNESFHKSFLYGTPVLSYMTFVPTKNGYLSLTLIQLLPQLKKDLFYLILRYLFLDFIGILALRFISGYLVDKALKPVDENQKRQTEFIASASHDLRSPLAVIQSNASALLIPEADPKSFVPKIIESCTYMSRLIGDLLYLAASDSKTWKLQLQTIDTESYLIDLYDSYSIYCKSRNHQLELDLPEDVMPQITADKGRLNQILSILIDNALAYSPVGTSIHLCPQVRSGILTLSVIDHGVGIPDSEKPKIFTRFYRTDKSRNDRNHFGLGLSIAKELLELQNGRIDVTDTPGGGSTFMIKLPIT